MLVCQTLSVRASHQSRHNEPEEGNDSRASIPVRNTRSNHLKGGSDAAGTAIGEEEAMHGTNWGISRVSVSRLEGF